MANSASKSFDAAFRSIQAKKARREAEKREKEAIQTNPPQGHSLTTIHKHGAVSRIGFFGRR